RSSSTWIVPASFRDSDILYSSWRDMPASILAFVNHMAVAPDHDATAASVEKWHAAGPPARRTRNQAAYSAGTKKIVSAVATVSPPMMEIAIGPQNTLRVSGLIASTVAAAVSITGRVRWTAASTTAFHASRPSPISLW